MSVMRLRRGAPGGGGRARGSLRCTDCLMHPISCLCGDVVRLPTETEVLLLTHALEFGKPTNTGRLLQMSLPNCSTLPCGGPRQGPVSIPDAPDHRTVLLYPGPDAQVVDAAFAHEDPRPLRLLVLDGTWSQARRLAKRRLADLPRVQIPDGPPTRFRLRSARDNPDHVCTIEAVARVLGIIEGHAVEAALLSLFETMVTRTLQSRGQPVHPASGKPR